MNDSNREESSEESRFRRQADHLRNIHAQEKQLLAFDFHDGLVQDLVAAKMLVDQLDTIDSEHGEQLAIIGKLIGRAIAESKLLVSGQFDLSLDQTVGDAIRQFVNGLNSFGNTKIELAIDDSFGDLELESDLKTNLYRIVQQAVYNAFFHAHAQAIQVHLKSDGKRIVADIEDDGRGFNAKAERGGIGLKSIRERTAMFAGEVKIESEKGAGTKIVISIPLKN